MERNQMRIVCNPYVRKIEYYWNGNMITAETSDLSGQEYTETTIQNKAYDILKVVTEKYNQGANGLDVLFDGTTEDYDDFSNVKKLYFPDSNIQCVHEEVLPSAKEIMPQIEILYKEIEDMFEKYNDKDIKEEIDKFHDTVKPIVSICVIGLYSAGKSAFINSLIGEEILPSSSRPTTAKTYRIISSDKARIKFYFDETEITLVFSEGTYSVNANGEAEVISELQEIMEKDKEYLRTEYMYRVLKYINNYDDLRNGQQRVSDLIEVEIPFRNSGLPIKDFTFVIYDTPGSDSFSNEMHLEVLKKSLKGQTNGFPIFVTDPNSMDKTENDKIVKLLDQFGTALDHANTMVVVNKADDSSTQSLEENRVNADELMITKWKSSRIFYVSSIVALGIKTGKRPEEEGWMNADYEEKFDEIYKKFADPTYKKYKQLYRYNIVADDRYEDMCQKAEKAESIVLSNSGLKSIEDEISIFSKKYALYNKCSQAVKYLNAAMKLVKEKIDNNAITKNEALEQLQNAYSEKEKALLSKLECLDEELFPKYCAEYTSQWSTQGCNLSKEDKEKNEKELKKMWEHRQKDESFHLSIAHMNAKMNVYFRESLQEYNEKAIRFSNDYWKTCMKDFKQNCCEIIGGSNALSQEQREVLKRCVMIFAPTQHVFLSIDLKREGVIYTRKILFFKGKKERFNLKQCIKLCDTKLEKSITEASQKLQEDYKDTFRRWKESLVFEINRNIGLFNSDLRRLTSKLEKIQNEREDLWKQAAILKQKQQVIEGWINFDT